MYVDIWDVNIYRKEDNKNKNYLLSLLIAVCNKYIIYYIPCYVVWSQLSLWVFRYESGVFYYVVCRKISTCCKTSTCCFVVPTFDTNIYNSFMDDHFRAVISRWRLLTVNCQLKLVDARDRNERCAAFATLLKTKIILFFSVPFSMIFVTR